MGAYHPVIQIGNVPGAVIPPNTSFAPCRPVLRRGLWGEEVVAKDPIS